MHWLPAVLKTIYKLIIVDQHQYLDEQVKLFSDSIARCHNKRLNYRVILKMLAGLQRAK